MITRSFEKLSSCSSFQISYPLTTKGAYTAVLQEVNCKCSVLNLGLESNPEINKICHPSFCNSTQRYSKCDCTQSVGLLFVLFLKIKKKTNSRIGIRQRLWSQSHR